MTIVTMISDFHEFHKHVWAVGFEQGLIVEK